MDVTEKRLEQTEKQKRAIEILKNNEIDKCCEWLLEKNSASAIRKVPNIEHVIHNSQHHCEFLYNKNYYKLGLADGSTRFPDIAYDHIKVTFQIHVNSECVLKTNPIRSQPSIKINLDSMIEVALDEWLEIIPKIVTEAQAIERIQQHKKEQVEESRQEQEKEKKTKEVDKKIDLGKYE